jgi:uncharacterized protein (DUF1330 family)
MPAYVIADLKITDPETYARYIELVPATIAAFGGRYVARGGATERLDGDWEPNRIVILEFDSMDQARAWWNSEDYNGPKAIRQSSAESRIILVDGA